MVALEQSIANKPKVKSGFHETFIFKK